MKQRVDPAMEILKEIASNDDIYFNDLIFSYRAYGYVNQKQYDKAISDLQKISKLDQASKFNLSLALMLKMKPNPHETVDRKLKLIKEIQYQFPDNKDIIRYHAIYIIQKFISQEVDISKQCKKKNFKAKMLNDLKQLQKSPQIRQMGKSMSFQTSSKRLESDKSGDLKEES